MSSKFLNLVQLRRIENKAINKHRIDLIDRAGVAIWSWVVSNYKGARKIVVFVGSGNNGSDGLSAAIKLKSDGYNVSVFIVSGRLSPASNTLFKEYKNIGGAILERLPKSLVQFDLVLDAILGIGVVGNLTEDVRKAITVINLGQKDVIAIDTPSGLNPFTGEVFGGVVKANHTLTFICDKPGFYTGYGRDTVGRVSVYPLIELLDNEERKMTCRVLANDLSHVDYTKLRRDKGNTSKGNFGTVLVVGGAWGMHGALRLAGRAAMLLGAGKVMLASVDPEFADDPHMPEIVVTTVKAVIDNVAKYSVIAIGPGLGTSPKAIKLLQKLIEMRPECPVIFDADALNIIAAQPDMHYMFKHMPHKIITPHPGEAARLLDIDVGVIVNNRFKAVKLLSERFNAITLLKGVGSLIQSGAKTFINQTGNATLSSGGQGDTLCGIIAAFIAQGMYLTDALQMAVYLHGLAAEDLAKKLIYDENMSEVSEGNYRVANGILASEVAFNCRQMLNQILYV